MLAVLRASYGNAVESAMERSHRRLCAVLLMAALPLITNTGRAQTDTATLQGTVLDAQGLVIPDAAVTVTNNATSDQRTAQSTPNGTFTFIGLPPGNYTLRTEHAGFQALTLADLVLNTADRKSVTLSMHVGAVNETITVQGAENALQTTDAAVSTVVNQQEVANMPLNGRSLQDLFDMTPGVIQNGSGYSVNGGGSASNAFIVDGVKANGAPDNTGGFAGGNAAGSSPFSTVLGTTQSLVPLDDLQEFRVVSSSYSAEFGGFNGGQLTFTTDPAQTNFMAALSNICVTQPSMPMIGSISTTVLRTIYFRDLCYTKTILAVHSADRCGFRSCTTAARRPSSFSMTKH